MTRNPVLEELYAAREQLLAAAGGDPSRYLEGVRERERASGRLLSAEEQKAIRCTPAPKSDELVMDNQASPPGDR